MPCDVPEGAAGLPRPVRVHGEGGEGGEAKRDQR